MWQMCCCVVCVILAVIPVRFNPDTYNVMEGVNANAVITLAAQQDHLDFGFNVTVLTRDGTAMGEFTIKQTYT